jgi:hypothetical protein
MEFNTTGPMEESALFKQVCFKGHVMIAKAKLLMKLVVLMKVVWEESDKLHDGSFVFGKLNFSC